MKILTLIFKALVLTAFTFLIGYAVNEAMQRSEAIECNKLVKQAEEFGQVKRDLFYITKAEDEMCRAHNIIINAPVK